MERLEGGDGCGRSIHEPFDFEFESYGAVHGPKQILGESSTVERCESTDEGAQARARYREREREGGARETKRNGIESTVSMMRLQ